MSSVSLCLCLLFFTCIFYFDVMGTFSFSVSLFPPSLHPMFFLFSSLSLPPPLVFFHFFVSTHCFCLFFLFLFSYFHVSFSAIWFSFFYLFFYPHPPLSTFSVFKMLLSFLLSCLYFFLLFSLFFPVFPKITFYPPFLPLCLVPSYSIPPSFFSTSSLHLCSAEGCRGASTVNYPASITSTYSATPFHTPSSASRGTHTLTHTEWKRYGEHKRSCKFCLTLVLKCFFPLFHMFSQPICAAVQRTVGTNSGRHLPSFLA